MKYLLVMILLMCLGGFAQTTAEKSFVFTSSIDEQDPPDNFKADTMPRPITPVAPRYPESARKLGVEAVVWLKLIVSETGDASKVVVFRSNVSSQGKATEKEAADALSDLNASAINAAKQWKFIPAVLNGKPVKVWVMVPFKFKLDPQKTEKKTD